MVIDLEELKRLAQAATDFRDGKQWFLSINDRRATGHDERFVMATTPAAVLALIERVEQAERRADFRQKLLDAEKAARDALREQVAALMLRVERAEAALKGLHTDVSAALAEAERQSTGTHGMSVPYTGPFASGLRLPSVVRDLREQQRVISAALEGAK